MGGEHWGGASRESPYFSRCSSSLNFYWQSCFLAAFDGQHVSKQTGEYVPALDTKIARDGLPSVLRCVRSRPPDSLRHGISGIYSLLRLLAGENVVDATAANAATAINRVRSSMAVWTRRAGECCGEIGSRSDQSNNGGQPTLLILDRRALSGRPSTKWAARCIIRRDGDRPQTTSPQQHRWRRFACVLALCSRGFCLGTSRSAFTCRGRRKCDSRTVRNCVVLAHLLGCGTQRP